MRRAGLFRPRETPEEAAMRAAMEERIKERHRQRREELAERSRERRELGEYAVYEMGNTPIPPPLPISISPRIGSPLSANLDLTPKALSVDRSVPSFSPRPPPPKPGSACKGTPYAQPLPFLLQTIRPARNKERERWPDGQKGPPRKPFSLSSTVGYSPAAVRAETAGADERSKHWQYPIYSGSGFNTRNRGFPIGGSTYDYRSRDQARDLHTQPMRYGHRTQRERLEKVISESPRMHFPPVSDAPITRSHIPVPPDDVSLRMDSNGSDFRRYHAGRRKQFMVPEQRTPSPFVDKLDGACTLFGLRQRRVSQEITNHATDVVRRRGFVNTNTHGGYFQAPVLDPI